MGARRADRARGQPRLLAHRRRRSSRSPTSTASSSGRSPTWPPAGRRWRPATPTPSTTASARTASSGETEWVDGGNGTRPDGRPIARRRTSCSTTRSRRSTTPTCAVRSRCAPTARSTSPSAPRATRSPTVRSPRARSASSTTPASREFDPEAGNALLDQIGRPDEIIYGTTNVPSNLLTAELFADMWSTNCGLTVNIDQFDQSELITKAITGDFQVLLWRNHGQGNPGLEFIWWHSRHAEGLALNFGRINDPNLDALLEQTWATTDPAELDELGTADQHDLRRERLQPVARLHELDHPDPGQRPRRQHHDAAVGRHAGRSRRSPAACGCTRPGRTPDPTPGVAAPAVTAWPPRVRPRHDRPADHPRDRRRDWRCGSSASPAGGSPLQRLGGALLILVIVTFVTSFLLRFVGVDESQKQVLVELGVSENAQPCVSALGTGRHRRGGERLRRGARARQERRVASTSAGPRTSSPATSARRSTRAVTPIRSPTPSSSACRAPAGCSCTASSIALGDLGAARHLVGLPGRAASPGRSRGGRCRPGWRS